MNNVILKTEKLCKTFSNGGQQQHVLKNLDLTIYEGDFTVIMGSSGAGKSTLLYAISGMDKPTIGHVYFEEEEISSYSNNQLAIFRRKHCGFVFQQIYLIDSMSILDNILSAGYLLSNNKKEIIKKAKQLLQDVGLTKEVYNKFPSQLSGGEMQRVGIVRSLINQPDIIFVDEPTGQLNSASSQLVLDVLTSINQQNQGIIMVTHDIHSALRGNRILYLQDGIIHGECILGKYSEENSQRHDALMSFLAEMGW